MLRYKRISPLDVSLGTGTQTWPRYKSSQSHERPQFTYLQDFPLETNKTSEFNIQVADTSVTFSFALYRYI